MSTAVGWGLLKAKARSVGYNPEVQEVFDDDLPKEWTGEEDAAPNPNRPSPLQSPQSPTRGPILVRCLCGLGSMRTILYEAF